MTLLKDYAFQLQERNQHQKQRFNSLHLNVSADGPSLLKQLTTNHISKAEQIQQAKSPNNIKTQVKQQEFNDFRKEIRQNMASHQYLASEYSSQIQQTSVIPKSQSKANLTNLSSNLNKNSSKSNLLVDKDAIAFLKKNTPQNQNLQTPNPILDQQPQTKATTSTTQQSSQLGGLDLLQRNLHEFRAKQVQSTQAKQVKEDDKVMFLSINKNQLTSEIQSINENKSSKALNQSFDVKLKRENPNKSVIIQNQDLQLQSCLIKENLKNLFNEEYEQSSQQNQLSKSQKSRLERPYSIGPNQSSKQLLQSSNFVQKLDNNSYKTLNLNDHQNTPRLNLNSRFEKVDVSGWGRDNTINLFDEIVPIEKIVKLNEALQRANKEDLHILNLGYGKELLKLAQTIQRTVKQPLYFQ